MYRIIISQLLERFVSLQTSFTYLVFQEMNLIHTSVLQLCLQLSALDLSSMSING